MRERRTRTSPNSAATKNPFKTIRTRTATRASAVMRLWDARRARRYFASCRRRSCGDPAKVALGVDSVVGMADWVTGLDHVQLAAPPGGEDRARAFYGGLLGLPELDKPEALRARGGAWFACGPQRLHVGVEDPFAPARKAHPALKATDVDALAARLQDAGVPVRWDDAIPGVRRFYAEDPFGNRVEFTA